MKQTAFLPRSRKLWGNKQVQALLLDHNQNDCAQLQEHLAQAGYKTVAVASVKQAREALMRDSFDVFLLEVKLPDGHGFQLCDEIRERWGEEMVIIFVSNEATPDRRITGIQLGADDFMAKPCDADELLARIAVRSQRRGSRGQTPHETTPSPLDPVT